MSDVVPLLDKEVFVDFYNSSNEAEHIDYFNKIDVVDALREYQKVDLIFSELLIKTIEKNKICWYCDKSFNEHKIICFYDKYYFHYSCFFNYIFGKLPIKNKEVKP